MWCFAVIPELTLSRGHKENLINLYSLFSGIIAYNSPINDSFMSQNQITSPKRAGVRINCNSRPDC